VSECDEPVGVEGFSVLAAHYSLTHSHDDNSHSAALPGPRAHSLTR
jgi:hypothetical protein